jgi:capsular polysaccharide biosynthesis protein
VPGLGAGLVAALLVVAVGLFVAAAKPTTWTAQSQMLLAPSLQGGATATSSYYATLTGGQLPATAAAIVQEDRFLTETRRALELSGGDSVTATVTVVPETAILNIEVTASNSRTAVDVADELPARAAPTVNRLLEPYFVTVLGSAHGTATQSSLGMGQWVALVALAALVAAIAVQQVVQRRARARVRREGAAGA